MFPIDFNEIRMTLLDPTLLGQETRREIVKTAAFLKGCGVLGMGASIVSTLTLRSLPFIGGLFALAGVGTFVAAHEVMVLSGNVEKIMKGDGVVGNIFSRTNAALSKNEFTRRLTQDTWLVRPLFASAIEASLLSTA